MEHKVGISGASGYVGAELLRLLVAHPYAEVSWISSREHAGKEIGEVHRTFAKALDLRFSLPHEVASDLDILFVAHAHGESMGYIAELRQHRGSPRIIDLGADFRLPQQVFEHVYGKSHAATELLETAVYGLPELHPERIAGASLVANPGCFAHCAILSLLPLARAGLIEGTVRINAITGSSGSGIKPGARTHHPERNDSLASYDVMTHRHVPEIVSALSLAAESNSETQIVLVPVSGPFSRGIFSTAFVTLPERARAVFVEPLFRQCADEHRFVRYRADSPRLIDVRGTNYFDVTVRQAGREVVIIGAIDNLGKGAAANAIQCMNIMCGWEAHTGLTAPALYP